MIRQPDDVLGRYLELKALHGAPRSQDLVAERGLMFAERCRKCGRKGDDVRTEEREAKTGASSWRCAHCSAVWPVEVGFLLRNEYRGGPRRSHDAGLVELSALGKLLGRLSLQEKRVYLVLYLFEDVGGYAEVAAETARRWPRMKPKRVGNTAKPAVWSEWQVRQTVMAARRKLLPAIGRRVGPRRATGGA